MMSPEIKTDMNKKSWWPNFSQHVREEYQRLASNDGNEKQQYKYMPYINLVYLMFLFLPLFFNPRTDTTDIIITLASLAIFLPLHFMSYRNAGRNMTFISSAMLLLCLAVLPYNLGANTYLIYAVISAAYAFNARNALVFLLVALVLMAIQIFILKLHILFFATTAAMASMLVFYTLYSRSIERSNQSLKLSQQEVQRLAQSAERERIGRDLHDVLGHTMSLIVMKSELASRLFEHDPNAAAIQIREVEKVARDAMGQIREAVTGMRLAGLETELANARLSLLSAGIQLHYQLIPINLDSEIEAILSLAVREAVTNVIRHSEAKQVEVELIQINNTLQLQISDDGKNTLSPPGHGLSGMRERLELVGGRLEIDTGPHGGMRLNLHCPILTDNKNNQNFNTSLASPKHEC